MKNLLIMNLIITICFADKNNNRMNGIQMHNSGLVVRDQYSYFHRCDIFSASAYYDELPLIES